MNSDLSPTILLVEEDNQVRPILSQNLRNHGFQVIVALNEADAIDLTRGSSLCPVLILLNQVRQSIQEHVVSGQRIRQRANLDSQTPIVVIAEHYGADMEGKNIQLSDTEYVTYLEDGRQLMDLLHRLRPLHSPQD
ncbi:MAG: response regulator [Stenomitos rutilans HA7619-LM2]|jgi:DNA-binding NtrC family response regulator|nr:response regulator [Stenomitos rutilans HA7619-LM2]